MGPTQETINTAKQLYGLPWISSELKKALENDFPELKESEDEKIRQILIDVYKRADMGGEIFGKGITYKQVIAYLEKQKEQKPDCKYECTLTDEQLMATDFWKEYLKESIIPGNKPTKEDIDFLLPTVRKYFSLVMKEACTICKEWSNGYQKGLEAVEQKPAEWSDKDESYLQTVISEMEANKKEAREYEHKTYDNIILWLKSLRPQLKRKDWTDEDSLAIKEIQNALEIYRINHGISEKQRNKLARWLDIHCNAYPLPAKLYPHWKPSEEQMRCLLDCVSKAKEIHNASVGGYDDYRILVSLYDELHKLL